MMENHQVGGRTIVQSSTTGDKKFIGKALIECHGSWSWEVYPEDEEAIRYLSTVIRDIPKVLTDNRPPGDDHLNQERPTWNGLDVLKAQIQAAKDCLEENRETNRRPVSQPVAPDEVSPHRVIDEILELASNASKSITEGREAYDEAALKLAKKADQVEQACIICLDFVFPMAVATNTKGVFDRRKENSLRLLVEDRIEQIKGQLEKKYRELMSLAWQK